MDNLDNYEIHQEPEIAETVRVYFIAADGEYGGAYDLLVSRYEVTDNYTTTPPPDLAANEAAIFNKDSKTWSIIKDYRGETVFNTETNKLDYIDYLRELKDIHTLEFPTIVDIG